MAKSSGSDRLCKMGTVRLMLVVAGQMYEVPAVPYRWSTAKLEKPKAAATIR